MSASFALGADIDLAGSCPLAARDRSSILTFAGTLDGRGRSIQNLRCSLPGVDFTGLFPRIGSTGRIIALSVTDAEITGRQYLGIVTGWNEGTIEDVVVSGTVDGGSSGGIAGAVVGRNHAGTIEGCVVTATVSASLESLAGALGGVAGESWYGSVRDCTVAGTVSGRSEVGGVVGLSGGATVDRCTSTATVTGTSSAGGVVGFAHPYPGSPGVIAGCMSSAAVTGTVDIGGIVGKLESSAVQGCAFSGAVTAGSNAGGIAGTVLGNTALAILSRSASTGTVEAGVDVGGIAGLVVYDVGVYEVHSDATVTGSERVGGVLGRMSENGATHATLEDAYFDGSVAGTSMTGGIVGQNFSSVSRVWASAAVALGTCAGAVLGYSAGTMSGGFYDEALPLGAVGCGPSTGATGLSSTAMRLRASYGGALDFDTPVWTIAEGTDFPRLAWE